MDDKLIIPDFVPLKDIEDYQYEVISGTPYRELTTENGFWKGVFEPLEFFNLLYEQHEIVITNIQSLKLIKRHLKSLELENRQRLYLLYNLKYLLNFNEDSGKNKGNISITAVCNLIGDEIQSLIEQLFEHYKKDTEYPENRFDYAREIKHINSLADNNTKYSYLQDLLWKFETTDCLHWEEKKKWDGKYFRNLMIKERDKYYQGEIPLVPSRTKKYEESISKDIEGLIKPESINIVYEIIKDFFNSDNQQQLLQFLSTGNNLNKPIVFKDNGNRFADIFKQLIEHDFLPGWSKKEVQDLISKNFKFYYRKTIKDFTPDYIEKCISRKSTPCKNPLINIINGEILKITKPRRKVFSKY